MLPLMIILISWPRNSNATINKPCPSDHTCIKKTTRDLCIRALNKVKRITRDCKIQKDALKLKSRILLEKIQKERQLYEKRITAITQDLKTAAKKDSRKALVTGILIGVGGSLILAATVTTIVVVYNK